MTIGESAISGPTGNTPQYDPYKEPTGLSSAEKEVVKNWTELPADATEVQKQYFHWVKEMMRPMETGIPGLPLDVTEEPQDGFGTGGPGGGPPEPPPPPGGLGNPNITPTDVQGNVWFNTSALVNLRYSMLEMQKANRDGALIMGEMEAELTKTWGELKQEEAKLIKKNLKSQAREAMYQMIGAIVSGVITAVGVVAAVGGAAAGGIAGGLRAAAARPGGAPAAATPSAPSTPAGGSTAAAATGAAPDAPAPAASSGGGVKTGILSGTLHGSQASAGLSQGISGFGSSAGQAISAGGAMVEKNQQAALEKDRVLVQAQGDLINKARDTLKAEADDALKHNDQIRQFLKQVSEDFAKLFNIAPH